MPGSVLSRLRGRRRPPSPPLHRAKLRAIDYAFEALGARSFADLGGVWAVEGGYTFHALERHDPVRAVLVDEDQPVALRERAVRHPALELVQGNLADPATVARVGDVDAVLLFDVLLHQVAPDWDEVLALYAASAWCFVIVGPQYLAGDDAVRLLDLGRERYGSAVPVGSAPPDLFDRLEDPHPVRGRPWRDVHEIWQWGITDAALRARMEALGFRLHYWADGGRWRGLDAFADHAFVFAREERAGPALRARGPLPGGP